MNQHQIIGADSNQSEQLNEDNARNKRPYAKRRVR